MEIKLSSGLSPLKTPADRKDRPRAVRFYPLNHYRGEVVGPQTAAFAMSMTTLVVSPVVGTVAPVLRTRSAASARTCWTGFSNCSKQATSGETP